MSTQDSGNDVSSCARCGHRGQRQSASCTSCGAPTASTQARRRDNDVTGAPLTSGRSQSVRSQRRPLPWLLALAAVAGVVMASVLVLNRPSGVSAPQLGSSTSPIAEPRTSSSSRTESASAAPVPSPVEPETAPPPTTSAVTGTFSGQMRGTTCRYTMTMTLEEGPGGRVTGKVKQVGDPNGNCAGPGGVENVEGTREGTFVRINGAGWDSGPSGWKGDIFELKFRPDGTSFSGDFWCPACQDNGRHPIDGQRIS